MPIKKNKGDIIKRQWTDEQKNYIITSYLEDGLTCAEIAKKFAAKPDTISKYLKEWGIQLKGNRTKNRRLKEDYFFEINTPQKAYFLGLLFADGAVVNDKHGRSPTVFLELSEEDQAILIKFRDELCSDASLTYNKRANREKGTYSFSVRSKRLADDLSKFNIIPNKTYVINQVIFPDQYLKDFLRGYIDGDGSIYYSNNSWHISITGHCKEVIQQFRDKIDELLQKEAHNKITCYHEVYKAVWNGRDAVRLAAMLYNNCEISLTRKQLKAMAAQEDKKS